MIVAFLIGVIVGAGGLAIIALRVAKEKSKPVTAPGVHAIGVDVNGKSTNAMSLHEATRIFREHDRGQA